MIITINANDTLYSISKKYAIPIQKIIADNGILNETLAVGQSLILNTAKRAETTSSETNVSSVAEENDISEKTLYRKNYILKGLPQIEKGTYLVFEYEKEPTIRKIIGGYAYDFISPERLMSVINYLTYIIPFTYGFTPDGELIKPNAEYILKKAYESSVRSLMHISTLTENGNFDSNLPSLLFSKPKTQDTLINNIINEINEKGYAGADIDFEFLPYYEKENYVNFIKKLSERLQELDKILIVAVPPKTSDKQTGLLVEGIDYGALGKYADYILIMAYEYGYKFGPPLAIAPIDKVKDVLDYAKTIIDSEKLLLGISNYGYDWTLPYVKGESDAPSISTVTAIELAKKYGSEIMFDEKSMAPYFFYTDEKGNVHEVWFEDARSYKTKIELIEEYNLAGGFIWDLMRENPQGFVTINSLIEIL